MSAFSFIPWKSNSGSGPDLSEITAGESQILAGYQSVDSNGDPVYGGNGTSFERLHKGLLHGQCLHAGTLALTHPVTGERMTFHAPLPPDLETVLRLLRKESDA